MARSFDGSTEFATGPTTAINFERTQAFSVAGWFFFASAPFSNEQALVGHLDTANNFRGWELHKEFVTPNSNVINFFLINNYPGNAIQKQSSFVPASGAWSHVGATYDGSSTAAGVAIYGNGVDASAGVSDDTLSATIQNSVALQVARRLNNSIFFGGNMADVAIWTAKLSALEMLALATGARPSRIRPSALINVGWWPLNGNQSPEPDLSGGAGNLTLTGTSLAFGPPIRLFTLTKPRLDNTSVPAVGGLPHHQPIINQFPGRLWVR